MTITNKILKSAYFNFKAPGFVWDHVTSSTGIRYENVYPFHSFDILKNASPPAEWKNIVQNFKKHFLLRYYDNYQLNLEKCIFQFQGTWVRLRSCDVQYWYQILKRVSISFIWHLEKCQSASWMEKYRAKFPKTLLTEILWQLSIKSWKVHISISRHLGSVGLFNE